MPAIHKTGWITPWNLMRQHKNPLLAEIAREWGPKYKTYMERVIGDEMHRRMGDLLNSQTRVHTQGSWLAS